MGDDGARSFGVSPWHDSVVRQSLFDWGDGINTATAEVTGLVLLIGHLVRNDLL